MKKLYLGMAMLLGSVFVMAQDNSISFFVTSTGLGNGGDLGGLEGADAHCQALADAAGAGDREWAAYLSTEMPDGRGISARTRIGAGPWHNANGELIAADMDELHISPNLKASTAITEKGDVVVGWMQQGNVHDILTGSMADGTAYFPDEADHTCGNWTSGDEGSAQVGHSDRVGGGNTTWNSTHASLGCAQGQLARSGGAGLFYCFAKD